MDDAKDEEDPLERLAVEVTEQVRRGHQPSSDELEEQFPELSEDMGGWVKTLAVLEEASFRRHSSRPRGAVINAAGQRQRVLGGFRLIREISRGGMGIVYEAQQESLQRRVAVKVLPPSPLLTDVERARFQREGTAVARLHHSRIVPVFGTGEENGVQYCVMQYIDGASLNKLVDGLRQRYGLPDHGVEGPTHEQEPSIERPQSDQPDSAEASSRRGALASEEQVSIEPLVDAMLGGRVGGDHGRLPVESETTPPSPSRRVVRGETRQMPSSYWHNVARIGAEVADALSHAHRQGVLHRDIKPGNLLLDRQGEVWVTDFGLAKVHDHDNLTGTGNLIGTLRYAPPEQFDGKADARSDIYSLGLTLYELCTLERAFGATEQRELIREVIHERPTRPSAIVPSIPRDLETVILKATAAEPENRYQHAGDLMTDLHHFLDDLPVLARRQTIWESAWRWCRRNRLETALGGFALAMLALFAIGVSIAYVRESRLRRQSDATTARTREALARVYESYLPDWATSSTVSAHGSISVSPASAQLLEGLIEFYEDLAAQGTDRGEMASAMESAAAMRQVGLIYHRLGKFKRSKASYFRARDLLSRLYRVSPSDDIRLEHAKVYNELGAVHWTERDFDSAYLYHADALRMLDGIASDFGNLPDVQFERARTLYLFGRRGRDLGGIVATDPMIHASETLPRSPASRVEVISLAVGLLEDMLDQDPSQLDYRHLVALCYREQADPRIDDRGLPVDESMVRAIKSLEKLIFARPDHPGYRYDLCTTLQWIQLGDAPTPAACDEAAERLQRSADLAAQLSQERPQEWIYEASRVESLIQLANVYSKGGRNESSLAKIDHAIERARLLAAKYPESELFQYWLAFADRRQGDLRLRAGQPQAALDAYDRSESELNSLARYDYSFYASVIANLHQLKKGRVEAYRQLDLPEALAAAEQDLAAYADQIDDLLPATKWAPRPAE